MIPKFLYAPRSVSKKAGPLIVGNTAGPFWLMTVGEAKQAGLKYFFDRGSQVTSGRRTCESVPRMLWFDTPARKPALRVPNVLGCRDGPLWICVMPDNCQPFTTLPSNRLPRIGLAN